MAGAGSVVYELLNERLGFLLLLGRPRIPRLMYLLQQLGVHRVRRFGTRRQIVRAGRLLSHLEQQLRNRHFLEETIGFTFALPRFIFV